MEFDIIPITAAELEKLSVVEMKMLRTAQQKKDELLRKYDEEYLTFKRIVLTNGMKESSLLADRKAQLDTDRDREVALLKDNLIYNMSINEPTGGGDVGGDDTDPATGYVVDYTLSYNERYVIVRNYYMSIKDPNERMALYTADQTARKYLSSYYGTLYDVLYTYSK